MRSILSPRTSSFRKARISLYYEMGYLLIGFLDPNRTIYGSRNLVTGLGIVHVAVVEEPSSNIDDPDSLSVIFQMTCTRNYQLRICIADLHEGR